MINTIVCPTDGSTHAKKALEFASDLAAKYGAKLAVVHVMGHGPVPDGLVHMAEVEHVVDSERADYSVPRAAVPHGSEELGRETQMHDFIGRKILEEAEELAKENGVKNVHGTMEEGDPASCILHAADAHNADLIVMGSRGLGNLKGLLMGSVSQKVSHHAKCTCACVK